MPLFLLIFVLAFKCVFQQKHIESSSFIVSVIWRSEARWNNVSRKQFHFVNYNYCPRSKRALAFHQCDPGSIPRLGVTCGLTLLLLFSALSCFSPGTPVFPSPQKPTFDKIWFVLITICYVPNRPFPNYIWPLFQSESWCSSFHMKISFHSHLNEN